MRIELAEDSTELVDWAKAQRVAFPNLKPTPPPCKDRAGADLASKPIDPLVRGEEPDDGED